MLRVNEPAKPAIDLCTSCALLYETCEGETREYITGCVKRRTADKAQKVRNRSKAHPEITHFAKHSKLAVACGFTSAAERDRYIAYSAECGRHPWEPCDRETAYSCAQAKPGGIYQNRYPEQEGGQP